MRRFGLVVVLFVSPLTLKKGEEVVKEEQMWYLFAAKPVRNGRPPRPADSPAEK